jgi:hypothetical protein
VGLNVYNRNPLEVGGYFCGESWNWWISVDMDTRWNNKSDEFEKIYILDKWIRDTKMEAMYRIKNELKEAKEDINKKGEELSKIQDLKATHIDEV